MDSVSTRVYISTHPLIKHKLTILRDTSTDHVKFRQLVRELALLLSYEATQDMQLKDTSVQTPMGTAQGVQLLSDIGLIPILRAGLGMVDGILELLPSAQVWHIGLYRDEKTLRPVE
jgi:uracil phosphoribosyltransferase